jgi:hypothetical protein
VVSAAVVVVRTGKVVVSAAVVVVRTGKVVDSRNTGYGKGVRCIRGKE